MEYLVNIKLRNYKNPLYTEVKLYMWAKNLM